MKGVQVKPNTKRIQSIIYDWGTPPSDNNIVLYNLALLEKHPHSTNRTDHSWNEYDGSPAKLPLLLEKGEHWLSPNKRICVCGGGHTLIYLLSAKKSMNNLIRTSPTAFDGGTQEDAAGSIKPTTLRLPPEILTVLDAVAEQREISRNRAVVEILARYLAAYQIEWKPIAPSNKVHYTLIAPTQHGKTFLAQHLFIKALGESTRVIVLDVHREYDYPVIPVKYDRTAPATSNQLFEMFSLTNIWSDVDRICRDLIRDLQTDKASKSIRLDVADPNAESMIVSEFLKRLTQVHWDPEVLLIVEEANKFDARAVVSRGRHCGIQVLLLSQFPLSDEVMSNTQILLGPISARLIETYDPLAASASLDLESYEFLWEEAKGKWNKFRLGVEAGS